MEGVGGKRCSIHDGKKKKKRRRLREANTTKDVSNIIFDFERPRVVYVTPTGVFVSISDEDECYVCRRELEDVLIISDRHVHMTNILSLKISQSPSDDEAKKILSQFCASPVERFQFFSIPEETVIYLERAILYGYSHVTAHGDAVRKIRFSIETHLQSDFVLAKSDSTYDTIELKCTSRSSIDLQGSRVNNFSLHSDDMSIISNIDVAESLRGIHVSMNTKLRNVCTRKDALVSLPVYIEDQIQKEGDCSDVGQSSSTDVSSSSMATSVDAYASQRRMNLDAFEAGIIDSETYEEMTLEAEQDFTGVYGHLGMNAPHAQFDSDGFFHDDGVTNLGITHSSATIQQERIEESTQQQQQRRPPYNPLRAMLNSIVVIGMRPQNGNGEPGRIPIEALQMPEWAPAPPQRQGTNPTAISLADKLPPSQYDTENILSHTGSCIACMENTPSMMCHLGHISMCRECASRNMKVGNLTCSACTVQGAFVRAKYPNAADMKCIECKTNFRSTACSSAGCMSLCTVCVNRRIDSRTYECPGCENMSRYIVLYPQGMTA